VIKAPWLSSLQSKGENVSFVFESATGDVIRVGGHTTASTFMVMPPEVGGGLQLQQALVRYSWDGEETMGMLERSTAPGDPG
jgi:hypothetical protein